jgi:hypothetical protein
MGISGFTAPGPARLRKSAASKTPVRMQYFEKCVGHLNSHLAVLSASDRRWKCQKRNPEKTEPAMQVSGAAASRERPLHRHRSRVFHIWSGCFAVTHII